MTTTSAAPGAARVPLALIDVGANVRELDGDHVEALARSIELRGLIVPLTVRPDGDRLALVAGFHRYAACSKLGLTDVEVTLREQEAASADTAAENILRKDLSPLGEARAVARMLDEGYTLDGAAAALGWSRQLVGARAKVLELPEQAQALLDTGALPVSAVDPLLAIAAVSPALCRAAVATVADGRTSGAQLARDPAWAIGHAVRSGSGGTFAEYLSTVSGHAIGELRLGKKAHAALEEAEQLHRQVDRYAYGPPQVRFAESDVDQARAAGVLIEFERGAPIICDRALYREPRQERDRANGRGAARRQAGHRGGAQRAPARGQARAHAA